MPQRMQIQHIAVPVGTCGKKLRWPSKTVATKALRQARKRRLKERNQDHVEKRVYQCSRCDGWHLTSMEKVA